MLFMLVSINSMNAEKNKVSYDGYLSINARSEYSKDYAELFTKAKLEFILKIDPDIKVEIDIRGNSNQSALKLHEVHALIKCNSDLRVKIGNIKRRFGKEELVSQEDYYTIGNSQINSYLSNLGYLSRDPGIQVYKKEGNPISYSTAFLYNQSGILTNTSRVTYSGILGSICLGLDGIYQLCTVHRFLEHEYEYPTHSYTFSMDVSNEIKTFYNELEGFLGLDPFQTQMSEISDDYREVLFFGTRWLSSYYFNTNRSVLKGVEPLLSLSILCSDVKYIQANSIELLSGINLHLKNNICVRLNGDLILTNTKYNTDERTIAAESKVLFESIIKW